MVDMLLAKALDRLLMEAEGTPDAIKNSIRQLIAEALADIKRIGINLPEQADAQREDAKAPIDVKRHIVEAAALCYVQACFGENPDRDKLLASYDMYLCKLKGMKKDG